MQPILAHEGTRASGSKCGEKALNPNGASAKHVRSSIRHLISTLLLSHYFNRQTSCRDIAQDQDKPWRRRSKPSMPVSGPIQSWITFAALVSLILIALPILRCGGYLNGEEECWKVREVMADYRRRGIDFWGPASNFGIPIAAVMDTQKDPDM